jgi:hypothetical protein
VRGGLRPRLRHNVTAPPTSRDLAAQQNGDI